MKSKFEAPDGGWGWAVVAGTALINVFNQSLLSLFGLVFGPNLQIIAGSTGVAAVMSINCTISNFSGLLISPLSRFFTTKQIAQIGVLLVASGLAFSTYSRTYTRIVIGYGILSGLGLGLIASSTFLIINSYFRKKKSQAVGFSMAGTSIGQMGMPPAVALLIDHYSYDGTILILSALSLHGLIGSMFFDPVSEHVDKTSKRNDNTDKEAILPMTEIKDKAPVKKNVCIPEDEIDGDAQTTANQQASASVEEEEEEQMLGDGANENETSNTKPSTFCGKLVSLFDFHILMDPIFVHIMVGLSLAYTTSISFSTFFPLFLTVDLDMTLIDASTCMSVLSFMDFVGRIIVPLATNRLGLSHRVTFIIGSFMLAICRYVLVLQSSYIMILVISGVSGLARAITVINQNLVIAEYSDDYVSSAVGFNMVSKGLFVLSIGTLLGEYKDHAHNYSGCINILNVISIAVAISWTCEVAFRKIKNKS